MIVTMMQEADSFNRRSLERVVSQRFYQMSISFPCQIFVMGFVIGVCFTSLFMFAMTSFGASSVTRILFSDGISSSSYISSTVTRADCKSLLNERGSNMTLEGATLVEDDLNERVSALYKAWENLHSESSQPSFDFVDEAPPHLENCKMVVEVNCRLDTQLSNGSFPPWSIWKGMLDDLPLWPPDEQLENFRNHIISEGAYPPWISGSDVENYPLTRKVQRDLWLHQHPANCSAPSVKFLLADWERLPGFGIGAQLAGMAGILAIAVNEKRVLVTDYYNRADHDGCKGPSRSSWSCYFFPETSAKCRERAFQLQQDESAWENGVITRKENYTSRDIWSGRTPRRWGNPWSIMQPTTEINGSLLFHHRKMDRRWWRAQAVRYLMRFPSEYTCNLMNAQRHAAFGWEAAKMVLSSPAPHVSQGRSTQANDIERFVWSNQKPWVPRPILSMHVRMGDKACEMKVVDFEHYMNLAERIRKRFPQLRSIWLSTEMQDVIDQSKSYTHWKFHYTNVTRQSGNMTMATYEASLGRETSTNYPLVNFLMAAEADFFIGALGSTWCFLIDGMRNTGGKVMSGYLSVNKDRFW